MEDAPQPIVIKRIVAGHGHHGGGWKVAFADFATAMMAFFLLMWLMGSTSAEQKGGISQYFKNPSVAQGVSPSPSPSAVQGPGGASSAMIDLGGSTEQYKNPASAAGKEDDDPTKKANATDDDGTAAAEKVETARLETLKEDLNKAIDEEGSLKPFKDQIMMDLTPEGLRIQIVDKESRSMFDVGGATLKDYSLMVLLELAKAIQKVPNRVSISGHTDQSKYYRQNYGNWELSTDRANSARRALIAGGLPEEKIGRVVGLASTALLDPVKPDNPINRRISIIVMNARTEQAIQQESASLFSVQDSNEPAASGAVLVTPTATAAPAPAAAAVAPNSSTEPSAAAVKVVTNPIKAIVVPIGHAP
jgi:chemotaxis protein MotB